MSKIERINVNITRIVSPTKFWLKLNTDSESNRQVYSTADEQNEYERNNLTWIKGIFVNQSLFHFHFLLLIN